MPKKPKENEVRRRVGQPQKYAEKCVPVAISMPPALASRLDEESQRSGRSRSALAVELLERGLDQPQTSPV